MIHRLKYYMAYEYAHGVLSWRYKRRTDVYKLAFYLIIEHSQEQEQSTSHVHNIWDGLNISVWLRMQAAVNFYASFIFT